MNLLLKMLSLRGLWNTGMEISSNLLVVWLWSHKECPMGISILESSESEVKVAQLCPTLCDPMDYIVHGTLQARILEWVAFPFSRGSSQPRDRTQVSLTAGGFFTNWAMRESLGFIFYNTVLCVCGHPSEPFAMETYTNMVMMFCCAVSNKVSVSDPEPHVFCQHLWNCGRLAC